MGNVSIIARCLPDGHVQYGWSGNGGYFKVVGQDCFYDIRPGRCRVSF